MRRIVLVFVFMLVILPAFSKDKAVEVNQVVSAQISRIDEIEPQKLTKEQTKDWKLVNKTAKRAFQDLKKSIDVSSYKTIENKPDISKDPNNKGFYYTAKNSDKSLIYNIKTGNLKYINLFKEKNSPKIKYNYGYPEGALVDVSIITEHNVSFSFNRSGEYIDFRTYMGNLEKKIKSNWYTFVYPTKKRAVLEFKVDKIGKLLDYQLVQSSNNKIFDEDAVCALKKSAPFDPLPSSYSDQDIVIRFTFDLNVKK